jgi:DNA-binding CsgD family transcriptional regulator/AraC-like DNA-binding protein
MSMTETPLRVQGGATGRVSAERWCALYIGGQSIRDIADDAGMSYSSVHRLLIAENVPLRRRGGSTKGARNANYVPLAEEVIDRVQELYEQGHTIREAATKAGVSCYKARAALARAGAEIRPSGQRRRDTDTENGMTWRAVIRVGESDARDVLSARELHVLAYFANGHTEREISEMTFDSIRTLHRLIHNIRKKLGARNKTHAVAVAFCLGLLVGEAAPPDA